MSAPPNSVPPPPHSSPPHEVGAAQRPGPSVGRTAGVAAGILALAAALGALGGWIWWSWWSPAPEGTVFERIDGGLTWVPQPAEAGYSHLFDATAQYAVIGVLLGAVLGALAATLLRHRELVGLAAAVLGSAVGAAVMLAVGTGRSPVDPMTLLDGATVGDQLPGALQVSGWTPYLGWPLGAVLAFVLVLLMVIDRSGPPRHR